MRDVYLDDLVLEVQGIDERNINAHFSSTMVL